MRILDISEAAAFTRLSKATLYKYKLTGRVPFLKVGSRVLFDGEKLQTWLEAHGHEANDTFVGAAAKRR